MKRLVFFLVFYSLVAGFVTANESKKRMLANRGKWQSYIKKNMSSVFCHDGGYFRSCFPIDLSECKTSVIKTSQDCFSSMKFPDKIDLDRHGIYFGSKVGYCVGQKLESDLQNRKSRDSKCVDPRKWL
ncbi:MAG: hypothetical protein A4S09_04145 [Proteobacteria bacterium SG_bin7]|nr:MAG: hypothetical protein A4S09_04145 [Proteobacteria bacterium SG_bin7]